MPLHSEREPLGVGDPDRFDSAVLSDALDDHALARLEDALAVQRVHTDGFLAEHAGEGPAGREMNVVPVAEHDLVVRMNFPGFGSRHPVVDAAGQLADFWMQ